MLDVSKMSEEFQFIWKIGIAKKIIERGHEQGCITDDDIQEFIPGYISSSLISCIQDMLSEYGIKYGYDAAIESCDLLFQRINKEKETINRHMEVLTRLDHNNHDAIRSVQGKISICENNIAFLKSKIVVLKTLLVNDIANKYSTFCNDLFDRRDIFQEGYLGLLKAADEYSSKFGVSFDNYAELIIDNSIREAVERALPDKIITSILTKAESIRRQEMLEAQDNIELSNTFTTRQGEKELIEEYVTKIKSRIPTPDISDKNIQLSSYSLLSARSRPKIRNAKSQAENPIVISVEELLTEKKDLQLPAQNLNIVSKTDFDRQRRLSDYAKLVGDLSEKYVLKYLNDTLLQNQKSSLRWIAQEGYTPGWDIEYTDECGKVVAIEVKGTTGLTFANVELTCNEWDAAIRLKEQYWIYLVADVFDEPRLERIQNPYYLSEKRIFNITPILWRLEMQSC